MVTTRILTRRRQNGGRARGALGQPAARRRRSARPALLRIAAHVDAIRLRLGAFAKVYVLAAATIIVTVAYLSVSASTNGVSYQLDTLQQQQQTLLEQQQALTYQETMLHTPARVAVAAQKEGMSQPATWTSVPYQASTFDVNAPIGQSPVARSPLWEQLLEAVVVDLEGAVSPHATPEEG